MADYQITISREVPNPHYVEADPMRGYDNRNDEQRRPLLEQTVTTATLDEEQWKAVQRAIIEVLK